MPDPSLGKKYTCFNCRIKFYDLNREEPICPRCGKNQKDKPPEEERVESISEMVRRGSLSGSKEKEKVFLDEDEETGEDNETFDEMDEDDYGEGGAEE